MVNDERYDTVLIERIARLEEAVGYNRELILSVSGKLDKLMEEFHENRLNVSSQYGGLRARVSSIEEGIKSRGEANNLWYVKLGLFITILTVAIDYLFRIMGKIAGG